MTPMGTKQLSYDQRKDASGYLMFLRHKCCGKIKDVGVQMVESIVSTSPRRNQPLQQS